MLAISMVACASTAHSLASSASPTSEPNGAYKVGAGTVCTYNGRVGPPSYLVRDIGKPGVPHLDGPDKRMLEAIMRYVHPSTLRFAYIGGHFAVFDAQYGPCYGGQYPVLNASWCNEIYAPQDADNKTIAGPGGCWSHPRPWIPHDFGNPKAPSWSQYDNSH